MWLRQLHTKRFVAALMAFLLVGTGLSAAELRETQPELERNARAAAASMLEADPSLNEFFENSVAYASFADVGKVAIGLGGARGHGVLYEKILDENGQAVRDAQGLPLWKATGYCKLTQATIGVQLGAQKYHEIIFFETPAALAVFKGSNTEFAAQASAVIASNGAAANAEYEDGVAVFSQPRTGAMFEAAIGGQKFRYQPIVEERPEQAVQPGVEVPTER